MCPREAEKVGTNQENNDHEHNKLFHTLSNCKAKSTGPAEHESQSVRKNFMKLWTLVISWALELPKEILCRVCFN